MNPKPQRPDQGDYCPAAGHRIIPDDVSSCGVPHLDHNAKHALNRLTAYNRTILEADATRCGCFHCGATFPSRDIVDWMPESDGPDTALCPCCGCDAVIYDTPDARLSTAGLSLLYMDWFIGEYKERAAEATFVPSFDDYDDFLRKGIPFLMESRPDDEIVGEIHLFPLFFADPIAEFDYAPAPEDLASSDAGGTILLELRSEANTQPDLEDAPCQECLEMTHSSGLTAPFTPWGGTDEALVCRLIKQYGKRLHGLIVSPGAQTMRLVVNRCPNTLPTP